MKKVSDLTQKKCEPCEGGVEPMTRAEFGKHLDQVPDWQVTKDDQAIGRDYSFKNFSEAMAFVNEVANLAENEGHHPDIYLHNWKKVKLTLSTHAIEGLSMNDFILAAKADVLYSEM